MIRAPEKMIVSDAVIRRRRGTVLYLVVCFGGHRTVRLPFVSVEVEEQRGWRCKEMNITYVAGVSKTNSDRTEKNQRKSKIIKVFACVCFRVPIRLTKGFLLRANMRGHVSTTRLSGLSFKRDSSSPWDFLVI